MFRLWQVGTALAALTVAGLFGSMTSPATAQETTTIPVGDTWFCASTFQGGTCETTVSTGDTVVWDFSGASLPHTSTGDSWDSDIIDDGSTFSFTFDAAGSYAYQCNVHPDQMQGTIIVGDAPAPDTPTDDGDEQPAGDDTGADPADDAAEDAADSMPATGMGPATSDSRPTWWVMAALAGLGISLAGTGAYAFRRSK
jgi:plastocyanin